MAGDEIPLPARIADLAEAAEVVHRMGGAAAVIEVARARAGTLPHLRRPRPGTAELAVGAAHEMHLPEEATTLLRRAAFVHDAGRSGVPASIWQEPGPLTTTETEQMRLRAYLVERMFSRGTARRHIRAAHRRAGAPASLSGSRFEAPGPPAPLSGRDLELEAEAAATPCLGRRVCVTRARSEVTPRRVSGRPVIPCGA